MRLQQAIVILSLYVACIHSAPASKKKGSAATTGLPTCKATKCPSGEKHIPKEGFTPASYGCLEIPQLDKCCVERDVCMQTCGMQSFTCFTRFVDCSASVCGTDSTCKQNAKVLGQATGGKDDKELCVTYSQSQKGSCECVSQFVWKSQLNKRLSEFYKKHQPDKFDLSGKIRDVDRIWNTWQGNESHMFLTLTMKYWDKAVDLKTKPGQTRKSSKKTKGSESGSTKGSSGSPAPNAKRAASPRASPRSQQSSAASSKASPKRGGADDRLNPSGVESDFASRLYSLERRLQAAPTDKLAQKLRREISELQEKELARLALSLERAVKSEDYITAKRIKAERQELQTSAQRISADIDEALKAMPDIDEVDSGFEAFDDSAESALDDADGDSWGEL